MAKIKITKKDKPEAFPESVDEDSKDEEDGQQAYDDAVEDGDFDDTSEWVEETTTARRTHEADELAKGMAEDVAKDVNDPTPPPSRMEAEGPEEADPNEDLNIDPDKNYPKIALLRVTVGDDDEQGMDEWLETVREALKDVTKNTTVLTTHRLIDGKQVANHRYEEDA